MQVSTDYISMFLLYGDLSTLNLSSRESLGGRPLFMGAWIVTSRRDLAASVPSWVQTQAGGCQHLESLQCEE